MCGRYLEQLADRRHPVLLTFVMSSASYSFALRGWCRVRPL